MSLDEFNQYIELISQIHSIIQFIINTLVYECDEMTFTKEHRSVR